MHLLTPITGLEYDWSRSASSSGRSRNRYRPAEAQPATKRIRPLSTSHDAPADPAAQPLTKESASSSGCLANLTSPYKQSGSNDYLASSLTAKSLSIEHRLANMSQMSINSQLSKNNSIRARDPANPAATPLQHSASMGNQHSTTPTPRESIVFSRGDDRPIAKILLSHAKSSTDTSDGLHATHKSTNSMNSATDEESRFYTSNRDRLSDSGSNVTTTPAPGLSPSDGNSTIT